MKSIDIWTNEIYWHLLVIRFGNSSNILLFELCMHNFMRKVSTHLCMVTNRSLGWDMF